MIRSYALYKILHAAITKLEHEGRIFPKQAYYFHLHIKSKALYLPFYSFANSLFNPVALTSPDDIFRIFKYRFQESSSLLGTEYALWDLLKSLIKF